MKPNWGGYIYNTFYYIVLSFRRAFLAVVSGLAFRYTTSGAEQVAGSAKGANDSTSQRRSSRAVALTVLLPQLSGNPSGFPPIPVPLLISPTHPRPAAW